MPLFCTAAGPTWHYYRQTTDGAAFDGVGIMRLTLRTMLAYMDDVLEPADADLLRKKIEESDFAFGLMERMRAVSKKLRMDAPKVDGKGIGNDANTVSEYLDSSLPQDRVSEFERLCLESDKHLSEVAGCHQILTIVLGKPAEIPAELRERIYALGTPERSASPATPAAAQRHHQPVSAAAVPKVVPPPVAATNNHPAPASSPMEVPDYLRAGQQPAIWPIVFGSAAMVLLAFLALRMLGPFDDSHPLAKVFRGQPKQTIVADSATGGAVATDEPAAADAPSPASAVVTTAPLEPSSPSGDPTASGAATPVESAAAPLPTEPAAASAGNAIVSTAAPAAAITTPAAPSPQPVPGGQAPGGQAAGGQVPGGATPAAPGTEVTAAAASPLPPGADSLVKPATPVVAAPIRTQPMEVGRFTSDGQLLATLNAADGLWYAKEPQAILVADERMVVLPPYRPQISLPSAIQLTFAGEGDLRLHEPQGSPTPSLAVEYGRFLAATAGRPGAEVELNLAGIKGVLTLLDADSVMAIKVARWVPPGVDPEAFAGIVVIEMYNANGRASWQAAEQAKVDIPPRHVHVYYGADPPETHGPFLPPDWIDSRNVRPIDRDAATVLERMMAPGRPITLSLQEVMKDRRVELRALAARGLTVLDDFEPALRELADPNQYSFWNGQFEALRQALSRGPETAAKVREIVTLLRPAEAKEIYRMLWGFSEEQVEKGGAADLVRLLEHEQMDIRVLAHLNLLTINGPWGFFRPERSPAQMRSAIQSWRDRLSKGAIMYRLPPSPLDTYKPAAPTGSAPPSAAAEPRGGASTGPNPPAQAR